MRDRVRLAVGAAVLVLVPHALATAQVPAGGEFRVNTYTTNGQQSARLAFAESGEFVVAWVSEGQYGPGHHVLARRYAEDGSPLTGEFRVGITPVHLGTFGGVASSAAGDFVVVWSSSGGGVERVFGRRASAAGVPLGAEFMLGDPFNGRLPDVASDAAGNFVVVWASRQGPASYEILGQRFSASGVRLGAEFRVNTYTTSFQFNPALAMNGEGSFAVVWESDGQDGSGFGIFGQRFTATGTPLGTEFRANTYTTGEQFTAAVAMSASSAFVVVWVDQGQSGFDLRVYGQRFSATGSPAGGEFSASANTFQQLAPSVAADSAGNFVVAWTSFGEDGSGSCTSARRFSASGVARGSEFRANTTTADYQGLGEVSSDPRGNFVIAWSSDLQDGSAYGVFAQRFGGLQPAALAVDTTGNRVFEPGEFVDVRPSWRNVNGAAQAFGGTAASLTGPLPATYTIVDGAADYGTVANGATAPCSDCFAVAVPTTARPVLHWDAVLEEKITPDAQGQDKLWRLHLGRSFGDVPPSSGFYRFVETLLHHSVIAGCGATQFCPGASTTRDQIAVLLLVAKEGAGYRPAACRTPVFADVPASSPFCPFVEELARRGVVAGCGSGNYCPGDSVTREEMAVLVLRTLDPAIDPPACGTPLFADVPASSPFCRWIEELARRGVVSGCWGGSYCPASPVTREQMGVFIGVTFGLTLYGP